jgi:hypothetical protein|tara:strand:- start:463 stop:684 length:222 start_codon:yes stop_codon:yes gene_type:complete
MNYNKIEIIENTTLTEAKRKFFIVSNKYLNILQDYKFTGGFLRYDIDHHTDTETKENKTEIKQIKQFLKTIIN